MKHKKLQAKSRVIYCYNFDIVKNLHYFLTNALQLWFLRPVRSVAKLIAKARFDHTGFAHIPLAHTPLAHTRIAHTRIAHTRIGNTKFSAKSVLSCIIVSSSMILLSTEAQAEDQQPLEDWYQVEIAIFAQNEPVFENELWPPYTRTYPADLLSILPSGAKYPKPSRLWHLEDLQQHKNLGLRKRNLGSSKRSRWRRIMNSISAEEPKAPPIFTVLKEQELTLNKVVRSLKRSKGYRLLHYAGWRQPFISNETSTSVLIQAGQHYGDEFEVDGYLTISRTRYHHVEADLWFTIFTEYELNQSRRDIYELSQNPLLSNHTNIRQWELNSNRFIPVQTHRLNESRRLKNSELNYLDHPAFGLIIKVSRYEPEDEDAG